MDKIGPIVIIDDDHDDHEILKGLLDELPDMPEIVLFENSDAALSYLKRPEVKPFLIISDIQMPAPGGFELRKVVFNDGALREKCIPFIFMTTGLSPEMIRKAYQLSVQGIFQKPSSLVEWTRQLKIIIDYWLESKSPNRF